MTLLRVVGLAEGLGAVGDGGEVSLVVGLSDTNVAVDRKKV